MKQQHARDLVARIKIRAQKTVQVLSADDKPTDDSLRFLVYAPIDTRSKCSTMFQFERVNNELSEYAREIDFCFPVEKYIADNKYRLI